MKFEFIMVIVVSLILSAACGDATTSGPENENLDETTAPPIPEYVLGEDDVECENTTQKHRRTSPDGCTIIQCMWLCANYENESPVTVSFNFRGCSDEAMTLYSESVQEADPVGCNALLTNP